MPTENSENRPNHDITPANDWEQLAHDAANNWDLDHPGVRGLYENHVVPKLKGEGLGHLAISNAELPNSSSSNGEDLHWLEPGHTGIAVEQVEGDSIRIKVVSGINDRRIEPERTSDGSNFPDRVVGSEVSREDGIQQLESERKKNVAENLRVLQKRFGERFVKGDLMEGGGYTGSGARELLAEFMDLSPRIFPGAGFVDREGRDREVSFAEVLKRLIPGKRGALQLLKDNHAYIQAALEQEYKDDASHERAPVKDPYELARSVGYELTGPFTSTAEFVPYDKLDFPEWGTLGTERLCTFNNPGARLKDYHMLWLRHRDVADTLPADKLTGDNLSDAWRTYLRIIGRYDPATDQYDLANLRPTRDDPYGTSSMSVQISRTGSHVSIKNRYNHIVGNPDNTLDSDLDNVVYGLKRAVYARVGREDLMNKGSVKIAEGYIGDNDGGIHPYEYEEDNVYYGNYEYIQNGFLTTIDPGKYYMISPQLYVPKSDRFSEIRLGKRSTGIIGLEVSDDIRFLYGNSAGDHEKDPRLTELRRAQAERDRTEITQRVHEALWQQAESSYQGYSEITKQLGAEPLSKQGFSELFDVKMAEWHENGVMRYIVRDFVDNDNKPNLLATPNIVTGWDDLRSAAVNFGKNQPYETYVYEELYRHYSAEELSGVPIRGSVRFGVMPSGYTRSLGQAPVDTQYERLEELRAEQPSLGARVPSVLEAITYWYALRAKDGSVADFDKTCIRHFNLRPVRLDSWPRVPRSFVDDGGGPVLNRSYAEVGIAARVLVG